LKKILFIGFLFFVVMAISFAWLVFAGNTKFTEDKKTIFIATSSSFAQVQQNLQQQGCISNIKTFAWFAAYTKYTSNVKAGKYVFDKNVSVYTILKTLKAGNQTPVKLVINKMRLPQDVAKKIAANFECDSTAVMQIFNNADSLKAMGLDSNTAITLIIPNTYELLWNSTATKIIKKLYNEQQKFWTLERKKKAASFNLTPNQIYTLASIVEEETNMQDDKGKIASVYLNRLEIGMKLGADPTVKFAMKDFGLKRIYQKHLSYPSPYNTYQVLGLPPGPICTPAITTIDAVLNAPNTTYLYFVAKPDFKGYSNFATTYTEHLQFAKAYQQALNVQMVNKALNKK
jgi:UPF0755 protein